MRAGRWWPWSSAFLPVIDVLKAYFRLDDRDEPRPEIANCHAAVSRLAGRCGDAATAAEHRAVARGVFDELTMAFWSGRE
jgi:hypothetical protein